MLSSRSKIIVTVAICAGLVSLFAYLREWTSWASDPAEDWYAPWIAFVVLIIAAGVSVAIDLRRGGSS